MDGRPLPGAATVPLLERDAEVAVVDAALAAAGAGAGRVILVEGPPGTGKSRLLREVRERARRAGALAAGARASDAERGDALGVVRQLLEPLLATGDQATRARRLAGAARPALAVLEPVAAEAGTGAPPTAVELHALFRLCATIAAERPLVLVVDDVHTADAPSLRFLGYLARRVDELPVVLALAARAGTRRRVAALAELAAAPVTDVLRPAPLSAAAVAGWAAAALDEAASDPGFAETCHALTGGNPLLVAELLREAATRGLAPTAEAARTLGTLAPAGVTSAVQARLSRVPRVVLELARSIAILPRPATLEEAAALAGLSDDDALAAAVGLVEANVLVDDRSLCFVHPLVRGAVLAGLSTLERALWHRRAARILRARGATPERIAEQLMEDVPHEDWAVETLCEAAARAEAEGAPIRAAAYLRRALDVPAPPPRRASQLAALGRNLALTGSAEAAVVLAEAVAAAPGDEERAAWAVALADVLVADGEVPRAVELLERLSGDLERRPELRARADEALLSAATASLAVRRRLGGRLDVPRAAADDPAGLAAPAFAQAVDGADPAAAGETAARMLRPEQLAASPTGRDVLLAATALVCADRPGDAERLATEAVDGARRRGASVALGAAHAARALAHQRLGRLVAAEADAFAALDGTLGLRGAREARTVAFAVALYAAAERPCTPGRLAELEARAGVAADADVPLGGILLHARAALLAAEGRLEAALGELLRCDRPAAGSGHDRPSLVPWRSAAALVLCALGDEDRAGALAREELSLARADGTARAAGIALRACAAVGGAGPRPVLLQEAVERLAASQDRLEHARSLIDLGAEVRREGRRREARRILSEGLALALRCGSPREVQRARAELGASGLTLTAEPAVGTGALTPAERRVVDLAAGRRTNREIAQALFLSEKTIETHLSRAYAKLGIESRRQLRYALEAA